MYGYSTPYLRVAWQQHQKMKPIDNACTHLYPRRPRKCFTIDKSEDSRS